MRAFILKSFCIADSYELVAPSIPPIKVPLEDLPSVEQPVSEAIKFLSALEQEIIFAFDVGETSKKSESQSTAAAGFKLKALCPISANTVKTLPKF